MMHDDMLVMEQSTETTSFGVFSSAASRTSTRQDPTNAAQLQQDNGRHALHCVSNLGFCKNFLLSTSWQPDFLKKN